MKRTYSSYSDPGHGWMRVPIKDLAMLDLTHKSFSAYSYYRGDYLYLEEDSDATLFLKTFEKVFGKLPAYREFNSNKSSKIRSYGRLS